MELEEIKELIGKEREAVKSLLKSILEDEGRLDNPFILSEAAKELYTRGKTIMCLKLEAPVDAEI